MVKKRQLPRRGTGMPAPTTGPTPRAARRATVREELRRDPGRADRAIAAVADVHHSTVARIRFGLELFGDIKRQGRRLGLDGKARAAQSTAAPSAAVRRGGLFPCWLDGETAELLRELLAGRPAMEIAAGWTDRERVRRAAALYKLGN